MALGNEGKKLSLKGHIEDQLNCICTEEFTSMNSVYKENGFNPGESAC